MGFINSGACKPEGNSGVIFASKPHGKTEVMSLSVIMPCYNEECLVKETICSYYKEVIEKIDDSEFIVIDDCSTDGTPDILMRMRSEYPKLKIIRQPVNKGHGQALMLGYQSATKDFIFNIDSDNCFKAAEFWKLYNLRYKAGLISGYRIKRQDCLIRKVIAKSLRYLNYALFGVDFKDANCPFKLIRRVDLEGVLGLLSPVVAIPSVMLNILLAYKNNASVIEIPVEYHLSPLRKSSLTNLRLAKLCLLGSRDILTLWFDLKFRPSRITSFKMRLEI